MRRIGTVATEEHAMRLADYLLTTGIDTSIEPESGEWIVWAIDEDKLDIARQILERFRKDPDAAEFLGKEKAAEAIREEARSRTAQAANNYRDGRQVWGSAAGGVAKPAPVTTAMILISILLSMWTGLGSEREKSQPFVFVTEQHAKADPYWDMTDPQSALADINQGEVWRLVTPVFLHLSIVHLIFNMMWLHQLGRQVENRAGPTRYILMLLALAVFSNLVQALIAQNPFFGGMSGVVYGLFGFMWMKVKFDPGAGYFLAQSTIFLMILWFVICFMPTMSVANGGHAGGLVLGVVMGYLSSMRK